LEMTEKPLKTEPLTERAWGQNADLASEQVSRCAAAVVCKAEFALGARRERPRLS
jgi:hypothetical protein